jgi:hypothetical protein
MSTDPERDEGSTDPRHHQFKRLAQPRRNSFRSLSSVVTGCRWVIFSRRNSSRPAITWSPERAELDEWHSRIMSLIAQGNDRRVHRGRYRLQRPVFTMAIPR